MGTSGTRVWQALGVAALAVPGVLLAELLVTGHATGPLTAAAVIVAVLLVAATRPVHSATGLALLTASSQLTGHVVLTLATPAGSSPSGCLPVVGRGAAVGLQLALLRVDSGCPAGSFTPGPAAAPTAVAVAAVLAALTVLVGHALAALVSGLMLTAGGGRAAHVARAVRVVALRIAALAALTGPWRLLLAVLEAGVRLHSRPLLGLPATGFAPVSPWCPGAVTLRGPPSPSRRAALGTPAGLTA